MVSLATKAIERRLKVPARPHALAFAPDGSWLAAAVGDSLENDKPVACKLHVWAVATGERIGRATLRGGVPNDLAVSADGRALFVALNGGVVLRTDPSGADVTLFPPVHRDAIRTVTLPGAPSALVSDPWTGLLIVAASKGPWAGSNGLFVLDPATGASLGELPLASQTEELALSPDGALLLRGAAMGEWELWGNPAASVLPSR